MSFSTNTLYTSASTENVVTTILLLIILRSFEYVIKALVTSSGSNKLSTGKFALRIAIDQAFNPLNYIAWYRGKADFEKSKKLTDPSWDSNPIPWRRALSGVALAFVVLFLEALLFYAVTPESTPLFVGQLHLQVNQTNKPQGYKIKTDTCTPIQLETGRGKLNAVFAYCNSQTGNQLIGQPGTSFKAKVFKTGYSLRATLQGANNAHSTSETVFSLLMPGKNDNLVVPIINYLQVNPSTELYEYYAERGCQVNITARLESVPLSGCSLPVEASRMLEIMLNYVKVVQDGEPGIVGTRSSERIAVSSENTKIGYIMLQRVTAVVVLVSAVVLVLIAFVCFIFIKDDSTKIIAALLRDKTDQEFYVPAVSMIDKTLTLDEVRPI